MMNRVANDLIILNINLLMAPRQFTNYAAYSDEEESGF
jgi:hypothetical protein